MKKPCLGFTLIELLITLSVIGILFGIGVARYQAFNRNQLLNKATQDLKAYLRLAQDKALSGEKDCDSDMCGGDDGVCGTNDPNERRLDGWYVEFDADGYQIYGSCSNPVDSRIFGTKVIDLSSLGVSVTTLPSPNPILFKVLAHGTDVNGSTDIVLSLSSGLEGTITVTGTGDIR